jgi:hypothetical protein
VKRIEAAELRRRSVLRRWRGGGVEERKGGARKMQELEGILL